MTTPEDVTQEVLLAILMALPHYQIRQGISFRAFAFAIARHKMADADRAAARSRVDPVAELPDRPGSVDNLPEQQALCVEQAAWLHRLLQNLSPQSRAILTLRIVVGLSVGDTARALGMSAGAVRVAQHRVLRQLRTRLANQASAAAVS